MRRLSPRRQIKDTMMTVKLKDNLSISLLNLSLSPLLLQVGAPLPQGLATAVSLEEHRPPSLHRGHPQPQNALFA